MVEVMSYTRSFLKKTMFRNIFFPVKDRAMGLHTHFRDGAPMALIVCVGSFRGGAFWVENYGLVNPSLKDKKRHTRVHN